MSLDGQKHLASLLDEHWDPACDSHVCKQRGNTSGQGASGAGGGGGAGADEVKLLVVDNVVAALLVEEAGADVTGVVAVRPPVGVLGTHEPFSKVIDSAHVV